MSINAECCAVLLGAPPPPPWLDRLHTKGKWPQFLETWVVETERGRLLKINEVPIKTSLYYCAHPAQMMVMLEKLCEIRHKFVKKTIDGWCAIVEDKLARWKLDPDAEVLACNAVGELLANLQGDRIVRPC